MDRIQSETDHLLLRIPGDHIDRVLQSIRIFLLDPHILDGLAVIIESFETSADILERRKRGQDLFFRQTRDFRAQSGCARIIVQHERQIVGHFTFDAVKLKLPAVVVDVGDRISRFRAGTETAVRTMETADTVCIVVIEIHLMVADRTGFGRIGLVLHEGFTVLFGPEIDRVFRIFFEGLASRLVVIQKQPDLRLHDRSDLFHDKRRIPVSLDLILLKIHDHHVGCRKLRVNKRKVAFIRFENEIIRIKPSVHIRFLRKARRKTCQQVRALEI